MVPEVKTKVFSHPGGAVVGDGVAGFGVVGAGAAVVGFGGAVTVTVVVGAGAGVGLGAGAGLEQAIITATSDTSAIPMTILDNFFLPMNPPYIYPTLDLCYNPIIIIVGLQAHITIKCYYVNKS